MTPAVDRQPAGAGALRRTARMRASNSGELNGLVIKSSAPASSALTLSFSVVPHRQHDDRDIGRGAGRPCRFLIHRRPAYSYRAASGRNGSCVIPSQLFRRSGTFGDFDSSLPASVIFMTRRICGSSSTIRILPKLIILRPPVSASTPVHKTSTQRPVCFPPRSKPPCAVNHCARNCQPKTGSRVLWGGNPSDFLGAIKFLKDAIGKSAAAIAAAPVLDPYNHLAILHGSRPLRSGNAGRRILDCIVDQLPKSHLHHFAIHCHRLAISAGLIDCESLTGRSSVTCLHLHQRKRFPAIRPPAFLRSCRRTLARLIRAI